jgi:hypothetical protein
MSVELDISVLAQADVDAAAAWYDSQSFGLGDRFRERVEQTYAAIALTPGRFGPGPSTTRIAPVKRFPYFVLFREQDQVATVLAVYHGRRGPTVWRGRI